MIETSFFFNWEVTLIILLQTSLIQFTQVIAPITYLGDEMITILIIGFFYWSYDKQAGKTLFTALSLSFLLNPMIKNTFIRRRPYFDNSAIKCLKPAESAYAANDLLGQGFSFPSLHASNSMITFGFIANYIKEKGIYILSAIIILLVGFSRVFLGVHYPTDVIGGWILGIAVLLIVLFLQSKLKNQYSIYLLLIIVGLIGLVFCESADYFRAFGILIGMIIGFIIEERYVNFENTRNIFRIIIRLIVGVLIFAIFLLIFKSIFPTGNTLTAYSFRGLRYTLSLIVSLGIYPMIFKKFDKYFKA